MSATGATDTRSRSLDFRAHIVSDKDGPYYWHIKSGTIQREPPEAPLNPKTENRRSLVKDNDSVSYWKSIANALLHLESSRSFSGSI